MRHFTQAIPLVVGLLFVAAGDAGAVWPKKGDDTVDAKPAAQERAERERAAKDKAMKDWQAAMADSRWELEVKLSSGGPAVVQSDVLTFDRGRMNSETLAKAGFSKAEYSLYPPTEQSVAWESMQQKNADGVTESAIWRGEVTGDQMQGVIVKKRVKGDQETVENFSFTGRRIAAAPKPAEPAPAPTDASQAGPAVDAPTPPAAASDQEAQAEVPAPPKSSKTR
jgi:hypothetical protein